MKYEKYVQSLKHYDDQTGLKFRVRLQKFKLPLFMTMKRASLSEIQSPFYCNLKGVEARN